MIVLADNTEERHLPSSLKEYCKFIPNLEDLTGCDFLITPLAIPATNNTLILRHAEAGLCVQRKDIGDFVQSFTNDDNRLWFQLARLLKVTPRPWLLLIGDLKCDKEGKAVIDGRESGWEYGKIQSAIEWWEIRGGYYTWLSRDSLVTGWCKIWAERLTTKDGEGKWGSKFISRPIGQFLYELPLVARTLTTLPGLGEERAMAIYNMAESKSDGKPTLMDCLIIIQDEKVDGVGKKTRERVLRFAGWDTESGTTSD